MSQQQSARDEMMPSHSASPESPDRAARAEAERRRRDQAASEIGALCNRLLEKARARDVDRRLLPCAPHVDCDEPDVAAGAEACEAAGAHRDCVWLEGAPAWCARQRDRALYVETAKRLSAGRCLELDVENSERVLAAIPGRRVNGERVAHEPAIETDALTLVRAFLARKPVRTDVLDFTGLERWIVLAGQPGCGKSLAGVYAIARAGGLMVKAREFERIHAPVDEAIAAPLLFIDDLGDEHVGEARYSVAQITRVLGERFARCLPTICTTNLDRRRSTPEAPEQFAERYGSRIDDRLRGAGVFVALTGASLRGSR